MKPLHSFECPECDSQFEKQVKWNSDQTKCPECGGVAERIYMSRRSPHQQFSEPIVMWRYKDGKLGVAGHTDAPTPANADRVEIHNRGEYKRYVKELNGQHRSVETAQEERYLEQVEGFLKKGDRELSRLIAEERDPMARAILQEGLKQSYGESPKFREWFSEVME